MHQKHHLFILDPLLLRIWRQLKLTQHHRQQRASTDFTVTNTERRQTPTTVCRKVNKTTFKNLTSFNYLFYLLINYFIIIKKLLNIMTIFDSKYIKKI